MSNSSASSRLYVGMDVHKDTIAVAVYRDGEREPMLEKQLRNEPSALLKVLHRLSEEGELRCCYEAGPFGFVIQRRLKSEGIGCDVIAPSLIPQRSGERCKTDRLDARKLGRYLRSGELTSIRVPTESEENVRSLVRARDVFLREVHRSRQHVLKLLLSHDLVYRKSGHWTRGHWAWLRGLQLAPVLQMTLDAYVSLLETKMAMLASLESKVKEASQGKDYKGVVSRLRALRGVDTLTAMTLVTEIGDIRRFRTADQLMSYVGLGVREHSSGGTRHTGGITKAGSGRARRVLVEAAWHSRRKPCVGAALRERQQDVHPALVAHSMRAQERLHKRYMHLSRTKESRIVVTAVARELAGFVWAVMHDDPAMWATRKT